MDGSGGGAARLPALAPPGPPLAGAEVARWARHLALPGFGELAQRRLRAARVVVVGAGGLGCPVLAYLAAAGVGELVVVDDDVVEESNLQRQVLHGVADVGRSKADSAAESLAATAPWTRVRAVRERLVPANAAELLDGAHLVVDGADNFATRYAVADASAELRVPEVFGSLLAFDAQVGAFWPGRGATYRDVFPTPPPPGSVASCAEGGVLGALCGVVGSVMALEALKLLTGTGTPLVGRLLVLDALAMRWREVLVRAPGRGTRAPASAGRAAPDEDPVLDEDPAAAGAIAPAALAAALAAGEGLVLLDVRAAAERAVSSLPGARAIEAPEVLADPAAALAQLPAGARVVVLCRSGARSAVAAAALRAGGAASAVSLEGGLLAWARDVDPGLPVA